MAISYSRKTLGQTGDGHFSPIAAMDKESNSVLMFDTARFKYPPYWVPMEVLFQSMLPLDSATGKSRGYVVLKAKYEYQGRKVLVILMSVFLWKSALKMIYQYQGLCIKVASGIVAVILVVEDLLTQ